MDALVVVEPVFGTTRRIAEAVAEGPGQRVHAGVVVIAEAVGPAGGTVEGAGR